MGLRPGHAAADHIAAVTVKKGNGFGSNEAEVNLNTLIVPRFHGLDSSLEQVDTFKPPHKPRSVETMM